MPTPESKVKAAIREVLEELHIVNAARAATAPKDAHGFYWMPVPSGYGVSLLDFEGHYYGRYFAIEAKAPGKTPTLRQRRIIELLNCKGERAFVVDSLASAEALRQQLLNLLFLP